MEYDIKIKKESLDLINKLVLSLSYTIPCQRDYNDNTEQYDIDISTYYNRVNSLDNLYNEIEKEIKDLEAKL